MTDFPESEWTEESASTASDADREVLAQHDPLGTDLASQVAQGTKSLLPPPRGVRKKKTTRRRSWTDGSIRSGAGPDARDPQPLGAALGRVIEERGWQREVSLRHLLDRWDGLVGPTNAAHSTPESYKDTVLTVRCDATVWATQLRMLAPSLVAELNRQLGQGTVTRITVLGPTAPSWKHGPRSVRDGRGPRDTYG
ncbi:DUF721 domain-containing protein [Luteococcus sp. Sow4_B9]|uniref:DUF721 domain-containing protein n=1 Tax=Luteococcus sp. Sow4_B9 TaxID=3438792 RepID=UPI003F963D08